MKKVSIKSEVEKAIKTLISLHLRGVDIKTLSIAAFAGLITFAPSANAELSAQPALDTLHNSDKKLPGTESAYPTSEYTLTEVTPEDSENLPLNVIKYYNAEDSSIHYYEINFKNSVYGEGELSKYFKWAKEGDIAKLVETTSESDAILTIKYNAGDTINKYAVDENQTIDSISEIYLGKDIKGIVGNIGNIGNISSKFVGNNTTIDSTASSDYKYSTIYTGIGGTIDSVTSSFIGNTINIEAEGNRLNGTLVKVLGGGNIGELDSEFIGNNIVSTSSGTSVLGGLVYIASDGTVNNITSDFIRNTTSISSGTSDRTSLYGSVMRTDGSTNINSSKFIENSAVSATDSMQGGAIYNAGTSNNGLTITDTIFEGNSLKSGSTVFGGAIYNAGALSITNSIFKDNYVSGSNAKAGAIYTELDMSISANSGKTTEFSGNYTLNGSTKDNQAIYVNNSNATVTFSATDSGKILLKDKIDGTSGYNVVLTGDSTGTIGVYDNILNANIRANGTNIDLSDGNCLTYNILSLTSEDSAKYSLDVNFANNSADKFTLGSESRGTIFINDLNVLGTTPTTSKVIQILTGSDSISIGLSDDLINKYHKVTEREFTTSDSLTQNAKWGDTFNSVLKKETTEEGLRTAVSSSGRTNADSLEYYINKTVEDLGATSLGDTMAMMNQSDKYAEKTFRAQSADDTYTVTADLGKTSGTFNVYGYFVVGGIRSQLDANNHSLFEIEDGATVNLSNVAINNLADRDGSLFNIKQGGTANLGYSDIYGNTGSYAILNEGTLNLTQANESFSNFTGKGINGHGTTNITGHWDFAQGTSIIQDEINIGNGGTLRIFADDIKNSITMQPGGTLNSQLYIKGGTLSHSITGKNSTYNWSEVYIDGDTTLNADVYVEGEYGIRLNNNKDGVNLTTNADHLKANITQQYQSSGANSTVTLTGGTLTKNITAQGTNGKYYIDLAIRGDVSVADGAVMTINKFDIDENSSLTTSLSNLKTGSSGGKNDGTLNLTGGSTYSFYGVSGSGTLNITGDVTNTNSYSSGYKISQDTLHIKEGAAFHVNGNTLGTISNFINDSVLDLTGGTIAQNTVTAINGSGKTQISGYGTTAYYTDFNQDLEILSSGRLYTDWGKIHTDVINNGSLYIEPRGINKTSYNNRGVWTHNITGDGTTTFRGFSQNGRIYLYIDNQAQIDTKLSIGEYTDFWTNADLLGNNISISADSNYDTKLYLTGGTLNHNISGSQRTYVHITENANVISNAIIKTSGYYGSGALTLENNSTLTISADNLDANASLYANANLKLTSGTWDNNTSGGTVTILSGNEVTHDTTNGTGKTISSTVDIENGAKFTASASNLTSTVNNYGELYLSGLLSKKYNGTGTTYIDKTLTVSSGAGFPATFDLNEGTLISNAIATYTFGHTTNNGGIIFNVNAAGGNNASDLFNLAATSDAVFDIKDVMFGTYKTPSFANTVKTYQILKGSPSYLTLGETMQKDIHIFDNVRDNLGVNIYQDNPENRYFDDEYLDRITEGDISATIELDTTDNNHDSVRITYGDYVDASHGDRIDLLSDWNKLKTTNVRNFNFRTADDVYTSLADVGVTTAGTLNINGISTTTTDAEGNTVIKRSVIDLAGHSGFDMSNSSIKNTVNLENIEFRNSNGSVFKASGDTFGTLLEDGTIQGGIVNCLFQNNSTVYGSGILYLDKGTIVHQILNSTFSDNAAHNGVVIYNVNGTINSISNSIFNNNSTNNGTAYYGAGGAIYNSEGTINTIIGSTFSNNNANGHYGGGAIYNSEGTINTISKTSFRNNIWECNPDSFYSEGGGAIYNRYGEIININESTFSNNSANNDSGGAIYNSSTINTINNSTFENNTSKYGGAIFNYRNGRIATINNTTFKNNTSLSGGAIFNYAYSYNNNDEFGITSINNSIFENNYSEGNGGAIVNGDHSSSMGTISNSKFINNSAERNGGAIYILSGSATIKEILNCTFIDNHSKYGAGAIDNSGTITISARDIVGEDGKIIKGITEFTGNYIGSELTENSNTGIYNGKNLTFKAENNGIIQINDKISNYYASKVILTGDTTGTINLHNKVTSGKITADNVNINTANGKAQDYTFTNFNSEDSAKWTIDVDFANNAADKFTVGDGTGTMYIDNLNVMSNTDQYKKVTVLNKTADDTTVLALKDAVVDIRDTLGDTVYNDDVFHQEAGYAVASSKTWNGTYGASKYGVKDQISQCIDEDLNALNLIASSDKNEVRNFIFRDGSTYTLNKDLDNMYAGTLNIVGVEGAGSTIDANGHKLFNTSNQSASTRTTINLSDIKLTGAETLISKYSGTYNSIVNISGTETILDGKAMYAQVFLNSGNLRFNTNTFDSQFSPLIINEGTLAINNDKTETYEIYNFTAGEAGKLAIDIDLADKVSDKISTTYASGTITVSSIDFINGSPKTGSFIVQVIKNSSSSANLQLAIDESIKHYVFNTYSAVLADDIQIDTDFNHEYYNRLYTGTAYADLSLTQTTTANDSIKVDIKAEWNDNPEIVDSMGDTLYLVNNADLDNRNFNSASANNIFNLTVDLDKTAQGNLTINGTLDENGNRSTINFKNHNAFTIGDNTNLTINNTRLTGARNLINVDSSDANLTLNNAYINGNILGSQKYNILIDGTNTTTVLGTISNADVDFNNGGLVIAENTFADDSTSLKVENDAYVYLNDGDLSNYKFSHINSSNQSKFGLDLDLETRQADNITAEGSGRIVFEKFDIVNRNLSNVDLGEDYTIQILHTSNDSLQLAISETVQLQLAKEYKIGTVHEILKMDTVLPEADWNTKWSVKEGDYDVYGKLRLDTTITTNDSLHLYELRKNLSNTTTKLGDTLMLMSILETDQDRRFYTDSVATYNLSTDIGEVTSGKMTLQGATDGTNLSVIDMGAHKGFKLSNETEMTASNIEFVNAGYKDGSLFNITNENSILNLDNVTITETTSTNAIKNSGTVNMTGGKVLLYSGISGNGVTNITGANVTLTEGLAFTQAQVNVNKGSLLLENDTLINGNLTIGAEGSAKMATDSLTSDVVNDGHIIFTNGTLVQNISGIGSTDIIGNVFNNATIAQDVNVQSGEFTTSADNIGGIISNHAITNISGTLQNTITGAGTTNVNESLTLASSVGVAGTLNLNDGRISTRDNNVSTHAIGTMLNNGTFDIDIDLAAKKSDKFNVGNSSNGLVYIETVNFINNNALKEGESFKVQVLETNGTDAIQIALNEALKADRIAIGTINEAENDLRATVNFTEKFHDTGRVGTVYATLKEATTHTTNDSIELTYSNIEWGEEGITERKDTLKELTQYETNEDKNFNFISSTDEYTVKEDLGKATEGTLNINGVSDEDGNKSKIAINNHSGFELTNDTTLNIKDVEIGGAKNDTLISSTNPNAVVNIKNSTLDGNINGTETEINITGSNSDTTTINGVITSSDTTLNGGNLKFNTETFADKNDSLTVNNGRVDVQDSKVDNYEINKLTSSENGKYSIDIDLDSKTSDKFELTDTSSSGTVYIDDINYINGELPTKFVAQVLDTKGNNDIQIKLSDEIKNQTYDLGKTERNRNDLKANVNFDEIFHDFHQDGIIKGSIVEATTHTKNDSIALETSGTEWGEEVSTERIDTLHEISAYETNENKSFNFKTTNDKYTSKADIGTVSGTLNVNGQADDETKSKIDIKEFAGFDLKTGSILNLYDVEISNAKNNTLITATKTGAIINIENNTLNGNISGNKTEINISGANSDTTILNGTITDSTTTLDGGTLSFNTNTFADNNDTLNIVTGRVNVKDELINTYDINKLTSSENAKYSIDIDLSNKTADKFNLTDTNSSGIVYIDDIKYINGDLPTEFIAQILDTKGNNDIQIKLSDEIKNKIYDFGRTEKNWNDLKPDVYFDEIFHDFHQEGDVKGSIKEATTTTTNDSIALKMDEPIWEDIQTKDRLDTLHEISEYQTDKDKTFNFKTNEDEYVSKANVGNVNGKLSVNGIKTDDKYSKINLNEFKGFELGKNSKLNINNTKLSNGADNVLITAHDESAQVTLNNSAVDGVITGVEGYTVNITGDNFHTFDLRHNIQNANINIDTIRLDVYNTNAFATSNVLMNSGILNMTADQQVADLASKTFHINGTFNMLADADLNAQTMDKLPSNTTIVKDAHLNVAGINLLSDTTANSVAIPFAYKGFKDNVKYSGSSVLSKETQITTAYAPIYKYDIRYDNRDDMGYFVFSKHGTGGNNGGNSADSYNPAVLASPVATQAAGQATMNETFRYVFEHADAFTQLPAMDRLSAIKANEYALSTDYNHNLGSLCTEHNNKAGWFRPYSTFETIDFNNGPKVHTINYGSLAGYDSDFRHLKHGWHNVGTGYIGYNGSQIHYNGVSSTMNGGLLGLTETFYKGNFWTALTLSAGAGVAETHTMYGKEDSTMLMAGVGSKTGYNFEFKEGKYILQPIMFMSYTFVNTFDYTNAAGVKINNDPMHTIQINPSIRFIANTKNGWQPYASVGMVWNLLNETNATANSVKLPEMHSKPYIEYGLGLQKNIKDNFTAFGQAMIRNGGRTGVALTAGFRWALGKNHEHKHQHVLDNEQVKTTPTEFKTSNNNRTIIKQMETSKRTVNKNNNKTTITHNSATFKHL